ncbi:conserved hypothetical protein [Hyphomonas neptunium ATCC 15444]|uniref:Oxidoreductase n=2 Tax=Hyphomonas TaxID=85 RepID=Q0C5D7_HYPNA|nr:MULTISPECIES: DUF934 domain-containing protein [Hyphomonas]ABI78200.1 conserved hypothetical protein [Hyphomonas neptunium ATCC 15444]KCZ95490.1 hypothetical protein HHI_05020 [Hyphomonas hirschiana VP5]
MPLIKNGAETANDWTFVADGADLPETGKFSVTLGRFLALKQGQENGPLPDGVRLAPADKAEDLEPYLSELSLIEVDFPRYTDGRGFSHAQLIRRRYGYSGELRAVGHVLRDQIFYMHRSGFDAYETARAGLSEVLEALSEYSVAYQPAADSSLPAFRRRS